MAAEPSVAGVQNRRHEARLSLAKKSGAILGIIQLDQEWETRVGDVHVTNSFDYQIVYKTVKGLSPQMCESGELTPEVEAAFVDAIKILDEHPVSGITGDCGFMMWFQKLARRHTNRPVFMSPLAQIPTLTCAYAKDEKIAIITSNSNALEPMRGVIKSECGVETHEGRFIVAGVEEEMGLIEEAAEESEEEEAPDFWDYGMPPPPPKYSETSGTYVTEKLKRMRGKVNEDIIGGHILNKVRSLQLEHPSIRAVILECTELPPYSDLIRAQLGLPVFDMVTCCDLFIEGFCDNPRFGINDWQSGAS